MSQHPAIDDPAALRRRLLAWRRTLGSDRLENAAKVTVSRLLQSSRHLASPRDVRICLYRALPGELDPCGYLEPILRKAGARIHYPRVADPGNGIMEMVEAIEFPPPHWHSGPFGIQELPLEWPHADPGSLDVIIVPGVAFGESGERMGMGAGYFDRYLVQAPQAVRISLALDGQIFPKLEQRAWDQPVDWVVAETREFRAFRTPELAERSLKTHP